MDISLAEKVEAFASTEFAFDNLLVHALDQWGESRLLKNESDLQKALSRKQTIKILHMEDFNLKIRLLAEHLRGVYDHAGPIPCTAVISPKDAPTADWHTDGVGVWMKVIRGTKLIQYENGTGSTDFPMSFDKDVYIAAGTKWRTSNKNSSMSLVFRMEQFMEAKAF